TTEPEVGQRQQRSVLGVASEVVRLPRDVVAELPVAVPIDVRVGEERIELGGLAGVGLRDQRATDSGVPVTGVGLDGWQIRLEGNSLIGLVEVGTGACAGELERRRMQRGV